MFSSTVRGYSSFVAYRLPATSLVRNFEIRLKFIPETVDQIALMLFIGREDKRDSNSDYFSLSFIKGYIALTWNLGAGKRAFCYASESRLLRGICWNKPDFLLFYFERSEKNIHASTDKEKRKENARDQNRKKRRQSLAFRGWVSEYDRTILSARYSAQRNAHTLRRSVFLKQFRAA